MKSKNVPSQKKLLAQSISALLLTCPLAVTAAEDGSGENAAMIEEVVTLGIRGSLQKALDIKQDADSIVDAINAEDIGKFPDKNVADSLQRIPGISVDRGWGEGRDIFVRGTDKDVNRTLMNGQNVGSAYWWANDNPSRGFNYSILASELVSTLEVYKSPQADHDEGSIGGAVNVRTRRPMDLDSGTFNASIEGQYSELPDAWDPQMSGLYSWKNDNETFGVLASYSSQKREMRRDGLEAFPTNSLYDITDQNGNTTEDVYAVWGGGSAIFRQERERETTNVTLQWRPSYRWDLVFNTVESNMSMDNNNQNYLFTMDYALADGAIVTDPEFLDTSDGGKALVGGTVGDASTRGAAIEPIYRDAYVNTSVYDLDVSYEGDGWEAHAQVGVTAAEGGSDRDQNYWFQGNTGFDLSLSRDEVEFGYTDLNATDGTALTLNPYAFRDFVRKMEDDEFYLQGDLDLHVEWGPIHSLKVGYKYRDHTIENNRSKGSADPTHPSFAKLQAITLADVSSGSTPELHGETATSGSLTRYAWLDPDLAAQRIDSILHGEGVMTYTYDQNAFYNINEEISAAYAKASFETEKLRGNFGVRVVKTDQTSEAYIDGAKGKVNRSYTDVLPSLNLVYQLNEDVIVRGALARTMARPTFTNLSSNLLIDATTNTASGGNPLLDPTYANQFEVGVEWYFGDASLFSATYFKKELSTYIVTNTAVETFNGETYNITRPFNADGADIQGIELQLQKDLGMGFGVIANYTYTDGQVASEVGDFELPGNSEDQLNASVYYEDDRFSARLSYNYRSEAYGDLVSGSQRVIEDSGQWDATFNWSATDNIDVFATAVNITNEVMYQTTSDGIPGWGFYENGSRFTAGVRLSF